jgi:exodeoxyribonuclease VII large subunit
MAEELIFGVSDFVAYLNQTLEQAYPYVTIEGELSNFRVSKNRWVYFDLKDEEASVRFFGTVYTLPGPLEDGMVVRVSGTPRLHPQYNFSVNVQSITPVGEGSIRRAADLLSAKLQAEGLFDPERKRSLPYPPRSIALITSGGSAAYADFIKISNARWRGLQIEHFDVHVQGEQAPGQIVAAITAANALAELPEVLVLTRGGGSAEDLGAFSTEAVTRAIATSRIPTLVAIGHEVDVCLAELVADCRASTPSNAAELLTPDREQILQELSGQRKDLSEVLQRLVRSRIEALRKRSEELNERLEAVYQQSRFRVETARQLLEAYNPTAALRRGYALVRAGDTLVKRLDQLHIGADIRISLSDGSATATVKNKERIYGKKI